MKHLLTKVTFGLLALGATIGAQSNLNPNIDVELGFIDNFSQRGHSGTFPTGTTGFSMSTTICNRGTQIVPWMAAMNPSHPYITFMVTRQANGRFEQISDWSYVKHGWYALASSQCTSCTPPAGQPGTYLGLGCSDTYGIGNNGDRYDLGPPAEINPWLGEWDPMCSHFDMGLSGTSCDGNRSLTNSQVGSYNSIENRVTIQDSDLAMPGAQFFYQGYYAVNSEGDAVRDDNMSNRKLNFNWSGGDWNPSPQGSIQHGTILNRWTGATISSSTNANDDGRVYVGVKVTGPQRGLYHYEYAFHNRDNFRGVGSVTIPKCVGASIVNYGFHDVDQDGGNDWAMSDNGSSVSFSTTDNAMRWNTVTNIWFDSTAAPTTGVALALGQLDAGPGAASFDVMTTGPGVVRNVDLGPGCALGTPLSLFTNNEATLGNMGFKFLCDGGEVNTTQYLFQNVNNGSVAYQGCDLYFGGPLVLTMTSVVQNNTNLRAIYLLPVPTDIALEGMSINFQVAGTRSTGGPIAGFWETSNGLRVRIGDSLSDCE